MFTRILPIAVALSVPAAASAGPIVWYQVPEHRVEDVPDHENLTMSADAHVEDHEFAVERRKTAIDNGRDHLKATRELRRAEKKDLRQANKALRVAKRQGSDLEAQTANVAIAERDVLEAYDAVDLAKARIDARKEHLQLEKARRSLAKAERELTESELLQQYGVKGKKLHKTPRYERQEARIARKVERRQTDWELARVDVRERNQDLYRDPTVVATWAVPSSVMLTYLGTDAPPGATSTVAEGEAMDLRRVHFAHNTADLDTQALNDLAWNAYVLRSSRDTSIRIEGHTDATGTEGYNRELAWQRAEAVEDFLTANGVWESQIETAGFGEAFLKVDTDDRSAANRRAELRVMSSDGMVDGTLDDAIELGDDIDQ